MVDPIGRLNNLTAIGSGSISLGRLGGESTTNLRKDSSSKYLPNDPYGSKKTNSKKTNLSKNLPKKTFPSSPYDSSIR